MEQIKLTPMMQQFYDLKSKHPDALILFRCGDFYETYEDDAADAAYSVRLATRCRGNWGDAQGNRLRVQK